MHFNIKCRETQSKLLDTTKVLEYLSYDLEKPNMMYGFNELLNTQRNKIDKINSDIWKKVRWYINDFDFLVKDPIINRAFYKFWEIINEFDIFEYITDSDIIYHCAEAPGGFIQASNIYLQLDCVQQKQKKEVVNIDTDGFTMVRSKKKDIKKYKIFTISLNKDLPQYKSYNLPSYNKSILHKNVLVTYGKDNTGDINNLENVYYIKDLINKQNSDGFYLITSDCGFDEKEEYNNKEQLHSLVIMNCIFNAVYLQKENGNYILKVFDIFTETSIQLLYLLNTLYDEVYIYKPKTSRPSNSEKYVICKGFTRDLEYKEKVIELLQLISNKCRMPKFKYTIFKLFQSIPVSFVDKIKQMNTRLLKIQCQFLTNAITLCSDPTFSKNYDNELQVSIEKRKQVFKEWEALYNLNVFV